MFTSGAIVAERMAEEVVLSRQAYGKIFLHAAKYFDGVVLGYLIGQKDGTATTISDVLPVCHANPAGPILDIAGDVADKVFKGAQVVGLYYGANSSSTQAQTPSNIERIAEGIAAVTKGECIIVKVCNSLMASKDQLFVQATTSKRANRKCKVADPMQYTSSLLDALLIQKINVSFADVEDHLNSSAQVTAANKGAADFLNPIATNFIAHYVPNV